MVRTRRVKWAMLAVPALLLVTVHNAFGQPSYAPRNDEPNPYQAGVSFGQLPDARKWGSTAGVDDGPDGTIWAYDRCGANTCVGATVTPTERHHVRHGF